VLDVSPLLHETLAGRYVLKREIGRGGAATVYLAHDVRHERLVAIKVLHHELSHALGAQRFLREIKLTASLQHPHILPIHDSGEAHDQLYYVMPYVEGDTMRRRLGADNRLSIDEAVRIGREVAGALAYAHERGVVHRDIKPENILFSGGHAVLADFGIARAIDRAHEKITQQGTITGTPAYMSPEQARDRAFDGRSDVYSLACVLYEAIAGVPPFVGETPQQLLTQRITKTAPLLREYRHDVPLPIESVIAKALAMSPDDRFDDARAFSAALSAAIGNSGETLTTRVQPRSMTSSPWLWAACVAVLATGIAASTPRGRDQFDLLAGRVDTAQYAIIPFQYSGASVAVDDQEPVAQALYAEMREWKGLKLSSDMSVSDAMHGSTDSTLLGRLAVARHARAGKLVWGKVHVTHDSMIVRAAIYNAVDGSLLREVPLAASRDFISTHPEVIRTLAADLLRLDNSEKLPHSGDIGTRSLAAWQAYQEGERHLHEWRVAPAMQAFERAIRADPEYAHPQLWLAQLQVWRGRLAADWGPHLNSAIRNRVSLDPRQGMVVEALQAIQHGNFNGACEAYRTMRSRDSLDVIAWLGLAQCQGFDPLVIRSRGSPSGWIFRGSSAGAQAAYARALQIAPIAFGAFPFNKVSRLYMIEANVYRAGVNSDSAAFITFPDLVHDTIASIAFPSAALNRVSQETMSPSYDRALMRNRDALLGVLSTLIQRLPDDADAFESLARVLETRDEISGTPNGGYSALSAIDRATVLSDDLVQRARLGATDVRLHLKLGDFARTASIGDSVLKSSPHASGEQALYLSGIAALLGHESDAYVYMRASGASVALAGAPATPLIEDAATALFMRAALGVCDDSVRSLQKRIAPMLDSYVNAAVRDDALRGVMERPVILGVECFGAASTLNVHGPHLSQMLLAIQDVGRGDRRTARARLDSMVSRRLVRPGEVALDQTIGEAWLSAALGDTVGAIHRLDLTLTALPTLTPYIVYEPGMAAAVGRAMAYRADLAARVHDAGTAALWAGRVLTLWAHSDPSVAPTLARMKSLAGQRKP
jgi:tRNA A-37 threonylcarbamoyl transferase component Bud32/tetratricopeptide (TPR) repeat protein